MDGAIRKAQERMEFVTRDREALREYHLREMALSDWNSSVNDARREGRAEGHREGKTEGRKEGAKELLDLLARGKTLDEAKMLLGIE
jgi:flagellar biosynthesis/type III secretory pathway protein FliH